MPNDINVAAANDITVAALSNITLAALNDTVSGILFIKKDLKVMSSGPALIDSWSAPIDTHDQASTGT